MSVQGGADRRDAGGPKRTEGPGLLAVGTVTLDTVEVGSRIHRDMPGGSALYGAAAAARHVPVRALGPAGPDFEDVDLGPLQSLGVDTAGIRHVEGRTQRWHAHYGPHGDDRETVASDRSILDGFRPTLTRTERSASAVFLGSTDPAIQRRVLDQLDPGARALCGLDTMEHWIADAREEVLDLVTRVRILFVTEAEAMALADAGAAGTAASTLLDMGPEVIVLKSGSRGARVLTRSVDITAEARPTPVVDPTGAGDAFSGGFLGRIARDGPSGGRPIGTPLLREALSAGVTAGARAVGDVSWAGLLRPG